ncbi:MAG TPA: hypothetical protein DCX06_06375 [Opitutae bacterium]|nr:hypothetical protein [Opitutae bacterium]
MHFLVVDDEPFFLRLAKACLLDTDSFVMIQTLFTFFALLSCLFLFAGCESGGTVQGQKSEGIKLGETITVIGHATGSATTTEVKSK